VFENVIKITIKTLISDLVCMRMTRFWNNIHQVHIRSLHMKNNLQQHII
jgi:hypothetical protein